LRNVFALANQKGGVGKTTTAINLGAAMAALEKPILIVDCDPQGNASRGLGLRPSDARNLYHALTDQAEIAEVIQPTGFPFLDIVPADRHLVGAEVEFVGEEAWQGRLRDLLEPVRERYTAVLLDCPPSLGHLTVLALTAAAGVVVPMQCEYFALEGISELVTTVGRVQSSSNPELTIFGVVLTMYDDRTNLSRDVAEEVRRHFGERVFSSVIPRNIRLAEAPSHGVPILQYDIKSRGAEGYLALGREFLERLS
jgi:chromosome partitioning protein